MVGNARVMLLLLQIFSWGRVPLEREVFLDGRWLLEWEVLLLFSDRTGTCSCAYELS